MSKIKVFSLSIVVHFFCCSTVFSQDNQEIINLNFDFGVAQINNEYLRNNYNSSNALNWGIGMEFGKTKSKFLPYFKYSQYQVKKSIPMAEDTTVINILNQTTGPTELNFSRKQISIGLNHLLPIEKKSFISFRTAILFNNFKEESARYSSRGTGILFGMGYLYRSDALLSYFINLNYEFAPANSKGVLGDWSGAVIQSGISLNLSGKNGNSDTQGINKKSPKEERLEKLNSMD